MDHDGSIPAGPRADRCEWNYGAPINARKYHRFHWGDISISTPRGPPCRNLSMFFYCPPRRSEDMTIFILKHQDDRHFPGGGFKTLFGEAFEFDQYFSDGFKPATSFTLYF